MWCFLRSSSGVHFSKKVHPLGVAPKPLAVWNKEFEVLFYNSLTKNLKTSSEDINPAALEPVSEYL
jgi:hypothetical protein